MAGDKILVLGGTGPAGICLVRELLHRNLAIVVYARRPEKLPEDVSGNPLLEVVKGELTDTGALSTAVSKSRLILSLLGPDIKVAIPPTVFADFYRTLFPLMREHGVRRIFAISTMSLSVPGDSFSFMRALALPLLRLTAPSAYSNVIAVGDAFRDEDATRDIDFTLFRVAMIPGESDAESWERDREEAGKVYVGPLGASGWTISQKRAALTRWLADVAESGAPELIGKMPAVSQLAGS